jgi:hypothetical protein
VAPSLDVLRRSAAAAVIAAVTLLGVAACAPSAGDRDPGGSTVAPSIEVTGRAISYDGLTPFSLASASARSATSLTVFAVGFDAAQKKGGSACGPAVLRVVATETARVVRVAVESYKEPLKPDTACPAIGYAASPHRVRLQRPLGDRVVVDAGSSRRARLLIGADLPGLEHVPSGLGAPVLGGGFTPKAAEWVWRERGEPVLVLQIQSPAALRDSAASGRIVEQTEVRGVPATVFAEGGSRFGQHVVQWVPNTRQALTLRVGNRPGRQWSTAQAVALAREVSNYAVEDTGRLAQPSTPGTAEVSYNSADGPVRHAVNMLKSSGVYVGIDCRGDGRVTVVIRRSTYRVDCSARLTHEVRESVGSPFDPFAVDITASEGVRWAVTLARASTDGS